MAPELASKMTAVAAAAAYVTLLAGDGDDWKGVVSLAKGLRKVGSAYPLVVAVLPDVPEEHRAKLREQGFVVREVEPVYPPEKVKVVHYCVTGKEAIMDEMLVKKRWDIYNDETLDFIKADLPADADEVGKNKKLPTFSNWLVEAKDAVLARKNLPVMVTLAAPTAAAGVVATAASPAICFSFYAVLIASMAVVTISLRAI